jgi:hypothetical protein
VVVVGDEEEGIFRGGLYSNVHPMQGQERVGVSYWVGAYSCRAVFPKRLLKKGKDSKEFPKRGGNSKELLKRGENCQKGEGIRSKFSRYRHSQKGDVILKKEIGDSQFTAPTAPCQLKTIGLAMHVP